MDQRTIWNLLRLFSLTFAIRFVAWSLVASNHMSTLFDESGYWERALALRRLDWKTLYGGGMWPPLYSVILAVASSVEGARFVNVLMASITAIPLYLLTSKLGGQRAAIVSVLAFAVYPVFVAFSHLLWSESLFSLLLVTAVYLFVLLRESGRLQWAVALGICMGLLGLTRSSAVPYVLVFALLLVLARQARPAAVMACLSVLIWLPWLITLRIHEGRTVLLATGNGYNLYLGNNPYLPLWSADKTSGVEPNTTLFYAHLDTLGGEGTIAAKDVAAQAEAVAFIKAHPGLFLRRCIERLGEFASPDYFVRRHFEFGLYPAHWHKERVVLLNSVGHWLILGFGIAGIGILPRHRSLFAALIVAGSIFPVVSIVPSRLNIPTLILLTIPGGMIATVVAGEWTQWVHSRRSRA